ncbi:hypothetical protein PoB_000950300 [Plakobranchus ocellatus]|uniref:Uncharacterized protein n=1 Tax=Plakobranchus ocellatus TaxID=259542 RepID=A0AAV3YKD9_9GAST|nr:hypothetical protein PoB_000950300 [Plakobranchus ocellatus]
MLTLSSALSGRSAIQHRTSFTSSAVVNTCCFGQYSSSSGGTSSGRLFGRFQTKLAQAFRFREDDGANGRLKYKPATDGFLQISGRIH